MNARASMSCVLIGGVAVLMMADACLSDDGECFWQLVPNRHVSGMTGFMTDVKLTGFAKGGELVLLQMRNPNPRYLKIDTQPGEPAEVILARMAAAFLETRPFNPDQIWHIRAEGNLLRSFPGEAGSYILAGTETGLGIPPPPTSLSVSYDPEKQEVSLNWEAPDEAYDAIKASHAGVRAGNSTSVRFKAPPSNRSFPDTELGRFEARRDKGLRRFYVVGCRNGVISSPAVITWDYDDNSQSELDVPSFWGGVSPNWKSWSHGGQPGALVLEEGTKGPRKRFDPEPKRVVKPEERSFFQIIKTRSPEVTGGVYRKFLGLKAGHTYRLTTRMSTLEMDPEKGDWSFSFHAAAHPRAVTLTSEQMAGAAALPGGMTGPSAGRAALYGLGRATKGKFEEVSTDKAHGDGLTADITLALDADTLTVWFRHSGASSTGVGFDWIKLKDVTAK